LLISSSENNGPSLVIDQALNDPGLATVGLRGRRSGRSEALAARRGGGRRPGVAVVELGGGFVALVVTRRRKGRGDGDGCGGCSKDRKYIRLGLD